MISCNDMEAYLTAARFSPFKSLWSALLALRTRLMNWSYRTSGQGRRVRRRVGERESEREEERERARSARANRKCRPRPPAVSCSPRSKSEIPTPFSAYEMILIRMVCSVVGVIGLTCHCYNTKSWMAGQKRKKPSCQLQMGTSLYRPQ